MRNKYSDTFKVLLEFQYQKIMFKKKPGKSKKIMRWKLDKKILENQRASPGSPISKRQKFQNERREKIEGK